MTQLIQMPNLYKEYNSYNFKYINEDELQQAINKVRRDRLKIRDQEIWTEFCDREIIKNPMPPENKASQNSPPIRKSSYYSIESTIDKINNDDIKQYLFDNQNEDKLLSYNINKNIDNHEKCIDKRKALGYSGVTTLTLKSEDADINKKNKIKSIVEKLNSVIIKTRHILEIIKFHVYDFKIPDIPEDVLGVQKKATEFCIRFSRNNLYQIELQYSNLLNINNLYLIKKPLRSFKKDEALLNVMLKLNQNILQAYLTLQRHMHIIWGYNGIADKLNVLLNFSMKVNNIYNFHKDFVDISLLHPLEDICHEMIESIKCLLNIKNPLEIIKKHKNRYSAYSSRPTTINSLYDTRNRRKTENKMSIHQNMNKRNIHSAMTHNQYYMYHNKAMDKTKLYCKICDKDSKKEQKKTCQNINQDVSRYGSSNSRQGSYHKNCHRALTISKDTSSKLKTIKKQFLENKDINDEKILNAILHEQTVMQSETDKISQENKIDTSINARENITANNMEDDNSSSDDEEVPEEVIQVETISNEHIDGLADNDYDDEVKNVKLVIISHRPSLENGIDPLPDSHNNEDDIKSDKSIKTKLDVNLNNITAVPDDTVQTDDVSKKISPDKINRISDILLNEEISSVTSEMEAPFNQFIQRELDDFSKFLFKTRNINKST